MTDKEAMKQWLEALEQVTKELLAVRDELAERGARPTTNVFHQRLWDSSFSAYTDHAIPAAQSLRQAITELESQEPVEYQSTQEKSRIETVPAQGGLLPTMREGKDFTITHPPQRTWVGLTDKEAQWLYDNCRTPSNLIDMVEARLKELNS